MSDFELRYKFNGIEARRELKEKIDNLVSLTKYGTLYKSLSAAYFDAKSKYILNIVNDSGAFGLGNKAAGGRKSKDGRYERFGQVRYTMKGFIIDPKSVYINTGDTRHYASAVADRHSYELDVLLYYPGSEGWDDFIEKAEKIVKEYMREHGYK